MKDSIQTVLKAQQQARAEVEAARAAADRRIDEARAAARTLEQRNADRLLRALRRYEAGCARQLDDAIRNIEQEGLRHRDRFMLAAEKQLDDVVARALKEIWPD